MAILIQKGDRDVLGGEGWIPGEGWVEPLLGLCPRTQVVPGTPAFTPKCGISQDHPTPPCPHPLPIITPETLAGRQTRGWTWRGADQPRTTQMAGCWRVLMGAGRQKSTPAGGQANWLNEAESGSSSQRKAQAAEWLDSRENHFPSGSLIC